MSGISAIYTNDQPLAGKHEAMLSRLKDELNYTGSDDFGLYFTQAAGLVYCPLPTSTLGGLAAQPLESDEWVLSFDGFISNSQNIRTDLRSICELKTDLDAEVLLMALQSWGVDRALERCAGAFTFLAFNKREQVLYAVRDRMGVKPLFMARLEGGTICFASTVSAIRNAVPDVDWQRNKAALASFFVLGAPFTKGTAFAGIERVSPAHYVRCLPDGTVDAVKYWEPQFRPEFSMGDLLEVLQEYQCVGVNSALFLSGGVDSAFLASVLDASECFNLESPETKYAEEVARAFGREFVTVPAELSDYEDDTERLIALSGEPLMNCPIPACATKTVRAHGYETALITYGADELFHGYPRTPTPGFKPEYLPLHENRTYRFFNQQLSHIFRHSDHFYIEELADDIPTLQDIGQELLSRYPLPDFSPSANHRWVELKTSVQFDQIPTIQVAAMAAGIEVRMPFLDHRIVEGVLSWPAEALITPEFGRESPLKEHLSARFPRAFFNRPKSGFSVCSNFSEALVNAGRKALERAVASGFIRLGGEKHAEHKRDMVNLGRCCFAYEKWKKLMGGAA